MAPKLNQPTLNELWGVKKKPRLEQPAAEVMTTAPRPSRPPSGGTLPNSGSALPVGAVKSYACKYFAEGHCKDGSQCRYSHAQQQSPQASNAPIRTTSSTSTIKDSPVQPPAVCRYFSKEGGCRNGEKCPMLHYNDFGHGVLHVPWSVHNTYVSPTGKRCSHWLLIEEQLTESEVLNSSDLVELLVDLLPPVHKPGVHKSAVFPYDFSQLVAVLDESMTPSQRAAFFGVVFPFIKEMALRGKSLFPEGVPILQQGARGAVRLTEVQVTSLLACCFLSLFPGRHRTFHAEHYLGNSELKQYAAKLGFVNFGSLFSCPQNQAREKIRCFINYFAVQQGRRQMIAESPMVIEVIRCVLGKPIPDLVKCDKPLTSITLHTEGVIEDARGALQVDFANHVLGGGVLNRGCVQEEIRFAVCPELLLSRIVCECLRSDEAVIINGAAQFSAYKGYASTFEFSGPLALPHISERERTVLKRVRDISVVAMDAVNYKSTNLHPEMQYLANWIQRDTLKALVSFSGASSASIDGTQNLSSLPTAWKGPVATGNWGCGAFAGDTEMKLLQQWMAASAVGRPLEYYTFGNEGLRTRFASLQRVLQQEKCTVGDVYCCLLMYHSSRKVVSAPCAPDAPLTLPKCLSKTTALQPVAEAPQSSGATDVLFTDSADELLLSESTELFFGDDASCGEVVAPEHMEGGTVMRPQTVFEYVASQFCE